jgi:hypothetical protein
MRLRPLRRSQPQAFRAWPPRRRRRSLRIRSSRRYRRGARLRPQLRAKRRLPAQLTSSRAQSGAAARRRPQHRRGPPTPARLQPRPGPASTGSVLCKGRRLPELLPTKPPAPPRPTPQLARAIWPLPRPLPPQSPRPTPPPRSRPRQPQPRSALPALPLRGGRRPRQSQSRVGRPRWPNQPRS